jgi:hypothetical protein
MTQAPGLLSRERIVAGPGFNRWLVPPAALAIHLCIGMVYGLSVFWLPLSAGGRGSPTRSPAQPAFRHADGDRLRLDAQRPETDFHARHCRARRLGGAVGRLAGARRPAPRRRVAAICWPGGLALAALGVYLHQLWLLWLGGGVVGGIGLGLGYISPVSTLVKWFPTGAAWRPAWPSWVSAAAR